MQKTFYKTASLISNSCKAIALLAGQTAEVSMFAYDYGRNLVWFCLGHLMIEVTFCLILYILYVYLCVIKTLNYSFRVLLGPEFPCIKG